MAFWKPGTVAPGVDTPRDEKASEETVITFNPNESLSIIEQRTKLPIYKNRDHILYLVEKYQVTIIVGQTGCGKTTQVPQYLHEGGWTSQGKLIGCTQPRRVAATSVAERVAQEMGTQLGDDVGYLIRFEDMTTKGRTKIKYMTDGMLIREMMMDPLLTAYSVIMVDEAHERSVYTDVMVGLLKKIMKKRPELKLIISSATLDAEDFFRYFNSNETEDSSKDNVSIISVEGRMYPVDILYLEKPTHSYIEKARETVIDIHLKEGSGDILIFLTGQEEVDLLIRKLEEFNDQMALSGRAQDLLVLPIYAGLPNDQQRRVFDRTPRGMRKVVVATNIAESSITIDGIVYVIDSGFVKIRTYNAKTGSDSLIVTSISKASAQQRAGRAGRVKPGKAFRLYTEEAFLQLPDNSVPEIQRTSLPPVLLQLKALGIDNLLRFDFMSPPPANNMIRALELLYSLGAIDNSGQLTPSVGLTMAELPTDPMLSKMLLASGEFGCSEEIATIAALLGVQQIWVNPSVLRKKADLAKLQFATKEGDHVTLLNVYQAFIQNKETAKWCYNNFLNFRSLQKAVTIRKQMIGFLRRFKIPLVSCKGDVSKVQKCVASGYFANAARLCPDGLYRTLRGGVVVEIHPTSILYKHFPQWVVFHEIVDTTKVYMREITVIEQTWLAELAPQFYELKKTS